MAARGDGVRCRARRATAASPTASTGSAGERRATTRTVTATTAMRPTPTTGRAPSPDMVTVVRRDRRWAAAITMAVTAAAASPAGAMWSKYERPERCRWPSTITFVRFDPGNEQRPRVGQEQTREEQRDLALASAPRRVHEYRCEEGDRSVEVQQRGDHDDEKDAAHVEGPAVGGEPRQEITARLEESVLVCHETDQKQAADEHERGPVLGCGGPCVGGGRRNGGQHTGTAEGGERPRRDPQAPAALGRGDAGFVGAVHPPILPHGASRETRVSRTARPIGVLAAWGTMKRMTSASAAGHRPAPPPAPPGANPRPEFDQLADLYDETRGGERRGDEFAELVAHHLGDRSAGPVFEVGVGTGVVALGLAKRGYAVVGLDVSKPMLARGRARLGPVVILGDAMDLPVATDGVVRAVSVWVVQSVPNPIRLFAEVARVLRPGGRYVVCTTQRPADDDVIGHIIQGMADAVDARRLGKRPRSVSVKQILEWSGLAGFRGEVHPHERSFVSSPEVELDTIARRSWPALRGSTTRRPARPLGRRSRPCGRSLQATGSVVGSST